MLAEALAAAAVGLAVLWLVLQPVLRPTRREILSFEPVDPEETPKGIALTALKEIEFDKETGKLSDADYEFLKGKYTAAALDALRHEPEKGVSDDIEAMVAAKVRALRSASTPAPSDVRSCESCGPRPEPDAVFCSTCGRPGPGRLACDQCGAALQPDSRFCEACGRQVAA
jgi:RNA polymerase subunit RPABC4/transcription elongation factor Spt4